jgi:hypothetical protein
MTSVGTWAIWTAGDPLLDLAVDRAQLSWGDDDGGSGAANRRFSWRLTFSSAAALAASTTPVMYMEVAAGLSAG